MIRSLARLTMATALLAFPAAASAIDPVYSSGVFSPVAVSGADVVGYFTENRHVKGTDEFTAEWSGATWQFASAANRAAFVAEPDRYAPEYGGYCAYAVAKGSTASTDPEAFTVLDGKLYLNYSPSIMKKWLADRDDFIAQADKNWPGLLAGS